MSPSKPRFRIVAGRPVEQLSLRENAVESARRRFGQPFAHEPGARWKPRQTPLLIEWLSKRKSGEGQ